jgi:hypothetical protein
MGKMSDEPLERVHFACCAQVPASGDEPTADLARGPRFVRFPTDSVLKSDVGHHRQEPAPAPVRVRHYGLSSTGRPL